MLRFTFRHLAVSLGAAFLLLACSGADDTTTEGVASVDDLVEPATEVAEDRVADDTAGATGEVSVEDAGLAFATCMRENGFADFPDPTVEADGRLNFRELLFSGVIDPRDPEVRSQLEACRDEIGAENLGVTGRGIDRDAIAEQLLTYTDCLRAEGLDVGDLTLPGQGGQGAQGNPPDDAQNADAQGQGRGTGTIEDRSARIANGLGLDPEDPATSAALDACEETLESVFAGLGAPPAPATDS
ncbi:MAG: hypothetical protein ACR2P0_08225 [Acidimicrobiales bacterium]